MTLIWKLLKENISKAQLIGFFIANLLGMTIVLVALQFYFDASPIFTQKDSKLFKRDYYTITKKIGFLDSFSSKGTTFTPNEVAELKSTGFVKEMGAFTPSQFSVYAGINQKGVRFGTEMFFESVPTEFIDIKVDDWTFSPIDNSVPIILPKNYLDLYNFGFAESRSMPKISENMLGLINLDITIGGADGSYKQMKGRIVGFSNRLNTILVPETFMEWGNKTFGKTTKADPARLIVEVNNITDPQISQFLKEKGYEVEGDNAAVSRMSSLLRTVTGLIIAVGAVVCILSFIILALSIYLLLEKNMSKLQKLRLIGYPKSVITKPYELMIVALNFLILVLSLVLVAIAQSVYSEMIQKIWTEFSATSIVTTSLIGFVIVALLSTINVLIIRSKLK